MLKKVYKNLVTVMNIVCGNGGRRFKYATVVAFTCRGWG